MSRHERFEEYCALAAIGEISAEEFAEMRAHIGVCVSCRSKYSAYADILDNQLPLLESRYGASVKFDRDIARQKGHAERFAARAESVGSHSSGEEIARS